MKSSCCGKCSNTNCVDFGDCTCFDSSMEKQLEYIEKMIKDGTLSIFKNE
jgi:hypothetical protein